MPSNVQCVFQPIAGLISCVGATECVEMYVCVYLYVREHFFSFQVSRTLTSQWGHLSPKSSTSYVLDIHTGDVRGGGTEAHVFVTLHGSLGDRKSVV